MAQDPDLNPPIPPTRSAEAGRVDEVDVAETAEPGADPYAGVAEVDKAYWIACLEDAERAERPWRERGREIVGIYRNETRNARTGKLSAGPVTFNILYANTEVMLPAVYQKPPVATVRSRFVTVAEPMPMPMPPGAGVLPPMAPPPGVVPPPPAAPGPADLAEAGPAVAAGGPVPPPPPPVAPAVAPPGDAAMLPPPTAAPPGPLPMMAPPMPPPGPQPAPLRPLQKDIDAAASVMERALQIVVEDEHSNEAIKAAIKDTLLPGRGVCRVRWRPEMKTVTLPGGPLPDGTAPTEDVKIDEQVNDEYVFWEDLLVDPVRAVADMNWIAFRHLFTREALEAEFAGSPQYEALKAAGRLGELFKWTDESAAKSPVGGGSAGKTAENLGGHIRKAMAWEIWDRVNRRIIWFVREVSGLVLRVDPDTMQLKGFYPIPAPMLAVTTTDSRIPRAYYDLYAKLADDLDEVSKRISRLTKQIKARGAYNSASTDIADILTADDNKMIPVDGVDLIAGGLSNHIWMVPIDIWVQALDKLFLAREQLKQAIYEIMGISDIMRGATKASETATAQRIKGSMGVSRLEDAKQSATAFVLDLLRLKAEIIGQNFDAATLERMTGEKVTPAVMDILRDDFQRTCLIDIETDSTVVPDEQAEQQSMMQMLQAAGAVMQGAQGLLQTGMLPPPAVLQFSLELLKMALHPIRFSRPMIQLIDSMQEKLAMMPMMPPPMPPPMMPPGGEPAPEEAPPGLPPGMPPPRPNGAPPPGLM